MGPPQSGQRRGLRRRLSRARLAITASKQVPAAHPPVIPAAVDVAPAAPALARGTGIKRDGRPVWDGRDGRAAAGYAPQVTVFVRSQQPAAAPAGRGGQSCASSPESAAARSRAMPAPTRD